MDPKSTDKRRLQQVQTQDLTESRINDDFVYWLKKNGSNYLLVVLLAACAALGYNYWQRKNVEKASTAWSELGQAEMPDSLERVAKEHADNPQVAMIALLSAGDRRLAQLRSGEEIAKQGDTPAKLFTDESRKIFQDAAYEDYLKAGEIAVKLANGNKQQAISVFLPTIFGRAAICESRGDFEGSKRLLDEAAQLAGDRWPSYEKLAKWRATETLTLATPVELPLTAQLPTPAPTTPVQVPTPGDDLYEAALKEQAAQNATGTTEPAPSAEPTAPPAATPSQGG